jgi:hypothetical protein
MSSRTAYRQRVLGVLAAVLGLAALPPAATAAIDKEQIQTLSVSEKLAEIRAATTIAYQMVRESPGGEGAAAIEEKLMAQWYNWGNWRNWTNWANWANWASYWNNY